MIHLPRDQIEPLLAEVITSPERASEVTQQRQDIVAAIQSLSSGVKSGLVGRDMEIDVVLAGLVSGTSTLLMGPPGTAKSLLVRMVADACGAKDGAFFDYLISNHTMPEELFGSVDLSGLVEGKMQRVTRGKMPEAEIAFLDEVFRGGSHILNTLLTIINEKRFDAGDGMRDVPLLGVIGAANTPPEKEEMQAFFDRFPVRCWVDPLLDADEGEAVRVRLIDVALNVERRRLGRTWKPESARAAGAKAVATTNHFRVARALLHVLLRDAESAQVERRRQEFLAMFEACRGPAKLSDRSLGQLWVFGGALDLVRGLDPALPAKVSARNKGKASDGHIQVFRHVARSQQNRGFFEKTVEGFLQNHEQA